MLEGEVEFDSNRHSEKYFSWYRGITRLRIRRFEVEEAPLTLTFHRCRITHNKIHKIMRFKSACAFEFVDF